MAWQPRHHHARPPPILEAEIWPPRISTQPADTLPSGKRASRRRRESPGAWKESCHPHHAKPAKPPGRSRTTHSRCRRCPWAAAEASSRWSSTALVARRRIASSPTAAPRRRGWAEPPPSPPTGAAAPSTKIRRPRTAGDPIPFGGEVRRHRGPSQRQRQSGGRGRCPRQLGFWGPPESLV